MTEQQTDRVTHEAGAIRFSFDVEDPTGFVNNATSRVTARLEHEIRRFNPRTDLSPSDFQIDRMEFTRHGDVGHVVVEVTPRD